VTVRGGVVARNYASALFDLAVRDGREEEFGEALGVVASLVEEVPGFALFLEVPGIARREKKRVLQEAFKAHVPGPVLNFILLVLDRGRQRQLGGISSEYRTLLDAYLGREHVDVTVARELDESGMEAVRERLSEVLGRSVIPHVSVDPAVMGGIVFRSGDVVYDGSVRRRLDQIKRRLLTADV